MWPLCTANSFLWLLLPLLIGLLTGWWAWARKEQSRSTAIAGGASVRESTAPTASDTRPYSTIGGSSRTDANAATQAARGTVEPFPKAERSASPQTATESASAPTASARAAGLTALGIPSAVGNPDDLHLIKGVGPKLNHLLDSLGVRRFDQIAAWGPAEIAKVDSHLGAFRGRIDRDNWVEQAKLLAMGAFEEFEARFGGSGSNES